MQITLVQTEIEAALRQYIGRKFTVANGVQMKIELAATRGAEGFKATIDVLEENQPIVATQRPMLVPRSVPVVAAQDESVSEEPEDYAPQETAAAVTEDAPTVADLEAAADQPTESTEVQTEAQPKRGRSLFGGLQKPKN